MIKIEFTKKTIVIFNKDGNKLGLKKQRDLMKDLSLLVFDNQLQELTNNNIILHLNPQDIKKDKDKTIWSVYGNDGLSEVNSYLLTFKQAVKMVYDSHIENEYEEYYIFKN